MLTKEMKTEIIETCLEWSKGLIENEGVLGDAYFDKKVTSREIEDYIAECKKKLLADL